jgi:ABC-2 type transport system permease protein
MTTQLTTPCRPAQAEPRDRFAQLLRAEWTKFRTVRGWVIGMIEAALVTVGLGLLISVVGSPHWHNDIERYAPMSAGLAIEVTTGLRSLPISPWGGLGVLAAWAAAALLAGGVLLRLRDA